MSLLEMTMTGGIMILVITVLRAIFLNKLPKKTFLILWEITMLRLILPFAIPSVTSVYSLFSIGDNADKTEQTVNQNPVTDIPQIINIMTKSDFQATDEYLQENAPTQTSIPTWEIIWIVGMIVLFSAFVIGFLAVYRKYRYATIMKGGYAEKWLSENKLFRNVKIYSSEKATSPLTYGIFRPIILLPKSIENKESEQITYILNHEMTHIRRFDMIRKMIAVMVLCVHWFNPVVWVMFLLYNRDIELTCDEIVVRKMGVDSRSAYALTLIGMQEKQRSFSSLYSHFSKNAIEERIVAIMKTKKVGIISATVACALILSVTFVFATSAAENSDKTDKTYYSFDNGKTFLKQEDVDIDSPNVEWWTYDEYKAWLDKEKVELQGCLGERAWTNGDGWFTWTQDKIDETIAMYEDTLEQIKNGVKYSKSVDGNDDVLIVQGNAVGQTSEVNATEISDSTEMSKEQILEKFGSFGISFDGDKMMYNGEIVRFFRNEYKVDNGMAIIGLYYNENGKVDVCTEYEATQNDDGSVDPSGKPVGLRKATKEEFESFDSLTVTDPTANSLTITYESSEIQEADKVTNCDNYESTIVTSTDESYVCESDIDADGKTIAEILSQYEKYGVSYEEGNDGKIGTIYYNGKLVKKFYDVAPNGSVFSLSVGNGEINIQTVYDKDGNLSGIKEVPFMYEDELRK